MPPAAWRFLPLRDIFAIVLLVLEAIVLLPLLYLLLLTFAGVFYRATKLAGHSPRSRFAVLVPAHNEEKLLPRLIESIRACDYPQELVKVFVVADNCTDGTAQSVASQDCTVFERHNDQEIGKGYALQWLLERIRPQADQFDAYIFVDADCQVSQNFMKVMDARFQRGELAVQSYYATANPTESWVSSLRYIALVLLHHARPSGREVLRLSCGIFGTGMALHRSLIEKYGWQTHGLAEDVEYYMLLTDNGVRIGFAREAEVLSAMPATLRASKSQNDRWEKGRLDVARRYVPGFLCKGLRNGSMLKIDAAIEQAIPPLSVVGIAGVALLAASIVTGNVWAIAGGAAVLAAIAVHVGVSLILARPPLAVLFSVAYVPWYAVWKLGLYARAVKPGRTKWVRTERSE
jgi:cellulose synthase/poly-beta-1,6-N-acetylglucosamine synthase-like glycosyltransferase